MADPLDDDVRAAADRFAGLLDQIELREAWIYLTGSAVLSDWYAGRSDLDLLVVTDGPLGSGDLDTLAALHAAAPERPYLDAVYIPRDKLGTPATTGSAGFPHAVDGVFRRDGHRGNPVLWATLDRHGVAVRGPAPSTLAAAPDADWLRAWNRDNLLTYWRPWAERVRATVTELEPGAPVPAYPVVWAATGPGRLHYTIATGEITSKTAAADYTASLFPEYADLLARAKAWRRGDDAVEFRVADGRAA